MTILIFIVGFVVALALAVVKALATDEVRGRIQRRVAANVEATIASLPEDLQGEWAEEWRAELAAVISMPIEAVRFARGLRQTATQLVGEPLPAPAAAASKSIRGRKWLRHPNSTEDPKLAWLQTWLQKLLRMALRGFQLLMRFSQLAMVITSVGLLIFGIQEVFFTGVSWGVGIVGILLLGPLIIVHLVRWWR